MRDDDRPNAASAARQRTAQRHVKGIDHAEVADPALAARDEPVQAVLVHPWSPPAAVDLEAQRRRIKAKAAVLAIFWEWTPGPSLAERRRQAYASLDQFTGPERTRQERRLVHLLAIAGAVGGPPAEAVLVSPSTAPTDGGDPLLAIFFRPSPGPASVLVRRAHARDYIQTLRHREHEQALRLYHRIGALTDPARGGDAA